MRDAPPRSQQCAVTSRGGTAPAPNIPAAAAAAAPPAPERARPPKPRESGAAGRGRRRGERDGGPAGPAALQLPWCSAAAPWGRGAGGAAGAGAAVGGGGEGGPLGPFSSLSDLSPLRAAPRSVKPAQRPARPSPGVLAALTHGWGSRAGRRCPPCPLSSAGALRERRTTAGPGRAGASAQGPRVRLSAPCRVGTGKNILFQCVNKGT